MRGARYRNWMGCSGGSCALAIKRIIDISSQARGVTVICYWNLSIAILKLFRLGLVIRLFGLRGLDPHTAKWEGCKGPVEGETRGWM